VTSSTSPERHAWRNRSDELAVSFIFTAERIARFFREIGPPVKPGRAGKSTLPGPEDFERLLSAAERYGQWVGTPEENAALGLS
jgi:hypothetical protein